MTLPPSEQRIAAVASLAEPTRRRVYDLVVTSRTGLTRDEVTRACGIPRTTAAFHLDRLTEDGLLRTRFERRTGRTGPGAGRPAKVYERSDDNVSVSIPPRSYDLAGDLLAAAIEESERTGEPVRTCLATTARAAGRSRSRPDVLSALTDAGYEPYQDEDAVALANCPFHAIASRHTDLVCQMNLHLIRGLLDGAEPGPLTARLAPTAQHCCVRLEPVT